MENSAITAAFLQGLGKWTGCYWTTRFGSAGFNLQGLKSSQTVLLARSTAGSERAEWTAATRWLEEVERDARKAEEEACLAVDLAVFEEWERALAHAQQACDLEAKYNGGLVWQPLRNVIAEHQRSARNGHAGAKRPANRISREGN
jgi:hypothetical protein